MNTCIHNQCLQACFRCDTVQTKRPGSAETHCTNDATDETVRLQRRRHALVGHEGQGRRCGSAGTLCNDECKRCADTQRPWRTQDQTPELSGMPAKLMMFWMSCPLKHRTLLRMDAVLSVRYGCSWLRLQRWDDLGSACVGACNTRMQVHRNTCIHAYMYA